MDFASLIEKIDSEILEKQLVSFSPLQNLKKSMEAQTIPPRLFRILQFLDWKGEEYLQFREPGKELDPTFFSRNYEIEVLSLGKLDIESDLKEEGAPINCREK